jgi:hypothetical protein
MPASIGHAIMIALPECRVECNLSVEHLLDKLSGLPQDDAALPEQAMAEAVLRGWHGFNVGPQHPGSGDVTVSRCRAGIHPAVSSRLRSSGSFAKSIDHFSRLVHRHDAGDAQELRIATAIPKPSLKRFSVPSRVTTTIFFRLAIPGPPVESPSTRCPRHTE